MTAHVSHHLHDPGDYWALHISAFLGRVCEIQPIEEAKLKAWMSPDVSRHRYICMRVIHVIGTINSLLTVLCMCPQDALSRKALQHTFDRLYTANWLHAYLVHKTLVPQLCICICSCNDKHT